MEMDQIRWIECESNTQIHNAGPSQRVATWNRETLVLKDATKQCDELKDSARFETTHFGFVLQGPTRLDVGFGQFELHTGMYFCAPGEAHLEGGTGFVVSHRAYRGMLQLGGPIENEGRLRYIDGCSDSVLLSPVLRGDPCLNFLYVPPGTLQTAHTHPSIRIGLIVEGSGICHSDDQRFELQKGRLFILPADLKHHFETKENCLRIVVYHPDSDVGPTHESHPMLNRTLVDGKSMSEEANRSAVSCSLEFQDEVDT